MKMTTETMKQLIERTKREKEEADRAKADAFVEAKIFTEVERLQTKVTTDPAILARVAAARLGRGWVK